jgi:hypothetical protein
VKNPNQQRAAGGPPPFSADSTPALSSVFNEAYRPKQQVKRRSRTKKEALIIGDIDQLRGLAKRRRPPEQLPQLLPFRPSGICVHLCAALMPRQRRSPDLLRHDFHADSSAVSTPFHHRATINETSCLHIVVHRAPIKAARAASIDPSSDRGACVHN